MKIAFYMMGGYAKVLRRCVDFLPGVEASAVCPNWQSYKEAELEPRLTDIDYLYANFNELFDQIDVSGFCERFSSINLYEVLLVDKAHFKNRTGDYQLRYICAVGQRLLEIFEKTRPDCLLLPIIETIDSMMAYRLAQCLGIRPIIYAHGRFSNLSFFSDSHYELLPPYLESLESSEADDIWAQAFIEDYRARPAPFNYRPALEGGDVYPDFQEKHGSLFRLLRNVWLKTGVEKHNRMIRLWISFQVRFQHLFLPVRNFLYGLKEKYYIRPRQIPEGSFDFFPLHFSPESSINVPAAFYIDQTRVVDRILLDRQGNDPLVVKEHPAMYGFRPSGFYRSLLHRPMVHFVHRKTPSFELIRKARTVYSVTGTACLEAFFLGIKWIQYGDNFLSDWIRRRQARAMDCSPEAFIRDVRRVSSDFVLYSPGRSLADDQILFAKSNVQKLSTHLLFHIKQGNRFRKPEQKEG
ncbi:MAG: hypothetical protein IPI44_04630 [Sulfuritalea sp.]|nr:hypothetical protein [Sulfuritalea sp.]